MHKLPKAFTFMGALLALTFCAVACKTDDDDEPTMYTVTVSSSIEHGTVTADKTSAEAGASVKLTATADSGYELDSYSIKDEKSNTITVTEGTFTMPKSNVTVSATFKETAETVNQNAADAVIAKISAIGTVAYTDESKAKIDDARAAYNALTEAQKALVPAENLALLTTAEATYESLAPVAVTGISLNKTTAEIALGETETLTATVSPDNATDKSVTWTSNATDIATVANGVVTAVAPGNATITAKAGDKTATCTVTVKPATVAVTGITLNKTTAEITVGGTETLTATVSPDNATDKTVTWTSNATDIATVANGVVTAVAPGSATITAKAGDKTATCAITVPSVVTWDLNEAPVRGGYSKGGVTLTTGQEDTRIRNLFYSGRGSYTFAVASGKIVKIEIVCTAHGSLAGWAEEIAGTYQPYPDIEPDYTRDLYKLTWTGEESSVSLDEYIYEIQSIVFTLK